jgi:cytochrome b pre-mRNA-processing protein 3
MFFKRKNIQVHNIYQNIVEISRSKFFYLNLRLKDNFETRFDLIIFHAFLIFYYYKNLRQGKSSISQELFDFMFIDFENNLREMGFGDIAVNKKMKVFITAFYGRIAQYSKGIDVYRANGDKSLLQQTILNNIYKGDEILKHHINYFIDYMTENIDHFIENEESKNLRNNFSFINIKYGA